MLQLHTAEAPAFSKEKEDDDVFAYSSLLASGEKIADVKKKERLAKKKQDTKVKEEDEDQAISEYSLTLAGE